MPSEYDVKFVAVANPKGGCGKTTICTNLASFLTKWGYSVVLLDIDSQSSAVDWAAARNSDQPRITVLPTPVEQLLDRLQKVKQTSAPKTVVLLDMPAAFPVEMELQVYPYLDAVLIPAVASPIDVRGMVRHVFKLYKNIVDENQWPTTGVIVNRAKVNTHIYKTVVGGFLNKITFPIIGELRDTQNYPTAAHHGKGIVELPLRRVIKDLLQWKPIIEWLAVALYPEEEFSWDVVIGNDREINSS